MKPTYHQASPFVVCAVIAVLAFVAAAQGQAHDPGASDEAGLLGRIREAYAECESYQDEGEVTSVFFGEDGERSTYVTPFTTAFVRPDRFRFEFRSRFESGPVRGDEHSYVIWTDEDGAHSWWTIQPEVRDWKGLSSAIGAATGVSGVSSYSVPSLLMPDRIGGDGVLPDGSKLIGEEDVDGLACYKIENPRGMTAWFDKEELLLRRIFSAHVFEDEGFSTETTTTYRPEFNVEVSDSELSFEPPAK